MMKSNKTVEYWHHLFFMVLIEIIGVVIIAAAFNLGTQNKPATLIVILFVSLITFIFHMNSLVVNEVAERLFNRLEAIINTNHEIDRQALQNLYDAAASDSVYSYDIKKAVLEIASQKKDAKIIRENSKIRLSSDSGFGEMIAGFLAACGNFLIFFVGKIFVGYLLSGAF